MRPSNKQRSRNKPGNQQRRNNMGNIVNRVFESAGPDGKVRGTPQQIIDKYEVLARDAQVSGDRVAAESFLQHAEHYTRLLSEAQRQFQENRQERDDRDGRDDRDRRDDRDGREEREDRDTREEAGREQDRPYASGGRRDGERRPPQPQPQHETAGLTTFGGDEPGDAGPVETPEAASWRRSEPEPPIPPTGGGEAASQGPEGEQREPEAGEAPTAAPAEAQEAAPPKRTRSRRKKQPAPAAENSAEATAE
jgi:Domain of unknown function (DUF4167)